MLWLLQYSKFYYNLDFTEYKESGRELIQVEDSALKYCMDKLLLKNSLIACNFTERFKNCRSAATESFFKVNKVGLWGEVNFIYYYKWLQYVLEVF